MRTCQRSVVVDAVPLWSLWVVAVVCFAPVTALWLLGALVAPFWVSMIAVLLTHPERFPVDSADALWGSVSALTYVVAGFVGLLGLLRVLTLSRRERPKRHRFLTIGMVAAGLAALLGLSYPIGLTDLSDGRGLVGLVVIVVLPFIGAAWLLVKSWRFLLAAPVHSDAKDHVPRT
jgi:hypothetical protein